MKRVFLFMSIISIAVTGTAFAGQVITTKSYVDRELATKQDTIPAADPDNSEPGTAVITYTNAPGTLGERGIFDFDEHYDFDEHAISDGHETDMLTATSYADLEGWLTAIDNDASNAEDYLLEVQDNMLGFDDMPQTTVFYRTCTEWIANAAHTDENCLLWALNDKNVYGQCKALGKLCWQNAECCTGYCGLRKPSTCSLAPNGYACTSGDTCASGNCINGTCLSTCKAYDQVATNASECCSGYFQSGSTACGCANVSECSNACKAGTTRTCNINHVCGCRKML